jgi:hypothetical protein
MTVPAPAGPRTLRDGLRAPVLVGAAGLGLAALLRVRDPHDSGTYGFCPFQALTDLPCPGCGGLRAVNDLTHGHVAAAVSSNVLAVALVVSLAALWAVWLVRRARGQRRAAFVTIGTRGGVAILVAVAIFGVLRNTPWGAWLAP